MLQQQVLLSSRTRLVLSLEEATLRTTGAFALIDSVRRQGVKHIFGYPGGAILPVYDEIYQSEARGEINHYLVRHEQGAVHAADGYARATGDVGVCVATSGPGATNLVTGIATAGALYVAFMQIERERASRRWCRGLAGGRAPATTKTPPCSPAAPACRRLRRGWPRLAASIAPAPPGR